MLYLIAFVGGLLTIASPCILPVLPFVFSRAGQSFRRSAVPLLIGMALTFAAVGSLAAVAGDWIVRANQYGRVIAMGVFAVVGVSLLVPAIAEIIARPLVRVGGVIERRGHQDSIGGSVLMGIATGLLWTPCAGPILGLILTGVAVGGTGTGSALLLLSFACGAACALAFVLMAGSRVLQVLKRGLGAEEWIRRGLGAAVLLGVVGIALGWDTGVLARLSLTTLGTATEFEQRLVDRVKPADEAPKMAPAMMMMQAKAASGQGGTALMPPLDGALQWLNGPPHTREGLRGKVVLFDFWTYSCINCLRAIPYVQAWAAKYQKSGLVVIGVHTPEFAFERDPDNVARATKDLKITYPIAVDSNRTIWDAFSNRFWPAHYLVDAEGKIRFHHFGEGKYDETERVIQDLLRERDAKVRLGDVVAVDAAGVQKAPDLTAIQSPETYVGYQRQENYASPQTVAKDASMQYTAPTRPQVNQWGLDGAWTVGPEQATLASGSGRIVFRFHARDLHLVLGPGAGGKPIRFKVTLDGSAPLDDLGVDVNRQGNGTVKEYRLYQLIRQKGSIEDRTFQIEFLDPGVQAFAFTFG